MSEETKKHKPRKAKPTLVEQRLMAGAEILKTTTADADRGVFWTFTDTGRSARGDIVERLIAAGKLLPAGDGLFAGESQTWRYAATA
jgi:hypothetical protein